MAAALAGTPVTDALLAILEDAIAGREPERSGCCEDGPACGDHEADQDRADAMAEVLDVIRGAGSDEEMLATLAIVPAGLLAGITGGARDDG